MSGYFFPHYFQQLLPVLCLTAALGAGELASASFWKVIPALSRQMALGLALFILPVIVVYPFIFEYSPKDAVRKIYPGNSFFAEASDLGGRIAQITRADDRIFIFGGNRRFFFTPNASRPRATFFFFRSAVPIWMQKTRQMETADEVFSNQPAAALYFPNGLFFSPGSEQYFTKWSQAYFRDNFRVDTFLAMDQSAVIQLVPVTAIQQASTSDDRRIAGALLVRNSK